MPESVIITAQQSEKHYYQTLFQFRELLYIFGWRDVKIRYSQAGLGIGWSVIKPIISGLILTLAFSKVGKVTNPSQAPYLLLVICGMLPWQFFSNIITEGSNSLFNNANLITKIYFPRLIIPLSTLIISFVDFLASLLVALFLCAWFHFIPSWHIVFLPFFIVLIPYSALGVGLLFSCLFVQYKDFRQVVPFLIQIGLYLCPIGYSIDHVRVQWRMIYALNPMVGLIDGFRWCIIRTPMHWDYLLLSLPVSTLFLYIGIKFFRKTERSFADVI